MLFVIGYCLILRGHSQFLTPNLDVNVYFWPKQRSTFSQISIAFINLHQNSTLYIDRSSWNCNIVHLIHIASMISWVITTDCWLSKTRKLPSATFLFNEDSESAESTCNLVRLGKSWNRFNCSQARKINLWL